MGIDHSLLDQTTMKLYCIIVATTWLRSTSLCNHISFVEDHNMYRRSSMLKCQE